jgi:anaerobic dimethyl sulfoxide reductase subunit A
MFGGCTELWSNISAEAESSAVRMTYGAKADYKSAGREPTDYVNSRLIVMWGWSPGDGTFGTGTLQYLKLAKKHGTQIICVDPRRTRTSWSWPTSTSSSGRRPTPPRSSPWPT